MACDTVFVACEAIKAVSALGDIVSPTVGALFALGFSAASNPAKCPASNDLGIALKRLAEMVCRNVLCNNVLSVHSGNTSKAACETIPQPWGHGARADGGW
jgi:hypothetical protein